MQLLRIKIHKKGAVPIKRRRREKFDIMKPYKLQRWVEITTNVGCSNMCLYCPQKKLIKTYFAEKRPANMSFRMFKKYLRHIKHFLACAHKKTERRFKPFGFF